MSAEIILLPIVRIERASTDPAGAGHAKLDEAERVKLAAVAKRAGVRPDEYVAFLVAMHLKGFDAAGKPRRRRTPE